MAHCHAPRALRLDAQRPDAALASLAALPALATVTDRPAPTAEPHRYTVLYVDDHAASLERVALLLARRPGVRLLSARDGLGGVELARSDQPDVVLMDVNLPGLSGLAALHILAADAATAHMPMVALSANVTLRAIDKGLQAGFFRYLGKPIDAHVFLDTLDQALLRARAHRAAADLAR